MLHTLVNSSYQLVMHSQSQSCMNTQLVVKTESATDATNTNIITNNWGSDVKLDGLACVHTGKKNKTVSSKSIS